MTDTLISVLETSAAQGQTSLGVAETGETWTLAELLARSRAVAHGLHERGALPGCTVGLIVQNDESFLRTLLGVQYAGAVPVPLALPFAFGGLDEFSTHLRRIVQDCDMRYLAVGHQMRRVRGRLAELLPGTTLIDVDELSGNGPERAVRVEPESLALLQYTSGSTAAPKGVRLTHRNVAAGLHAITVASEITRADILGAWLPLFHDMGLFSVLSGLAAAGMVWLWQPGSFVRHPAKWLIDFARYRCTLCAAPNFFFDYLNHAAGEIPDGSLDLSSWRLAYNGAEPVNASTIEQFHQRFAAAGLRVETMYPVYGMAEATLAVTFPTVGQAPHILSVDRAELAGAGRVVPVDRHCDASRLVVGVGHPVPGMRVRIAGAGGQQVGEIQISGTPVTSGYHGLPRDASHTADGWLRTGDLGFLLNGELYVVGRIKDMVIVHGINYFAEDAEALVRDVAGVYHQRCAAVPAVADDGAEVLALVVETQLREPERRAELAHALRARLRTGLGLPTMVRLVAPHSLPVTSSGKIRRLRVRDSLASGQLGAISTTSGAGR
jgi:acyl-CoA synthetase (AMP-forming)/AMP-acid ligase II